MSKKNSKPAAKKWEYYKELVGDFTDRDLKTLEKLAKTARTSVKGYYRDLRRTCEFATNQLNYRPGVYLVKFLVSHKKYVRLFEKVYTKAVVTKWWSKFAKKFGAYILGYCIDEYKVAGDDYIQTVVPAFRDRNPDYKGY